MPLDRARFEARVDRSGHHHIWLGAKSPGGGGQVRVDGKLLTAARAAWEIENGPVPDGVRVLSCPDEPACVRVDHLRLDQRAMSSASPPSKKRSPRGAGTITAISPGVWKIGITAGVDRLGQRRRTFRTIHGTRTDAAKALAALVTEVGDGHRPSTPERQAVDRRQSGRLVPRVRPTRTEDSITPHSPATPTPTPTGSKSRSATSGPARSRRPNSTRPSAACAEPDCRAAG